ncbi:MAG: FG-GAP-like repeat-containing protein [bacterium]
MLACAAASFAAAAEDARPTLATISNTPSWTTESDQVAARFGARVATAGDVNGDGASDILVSAPFYDNPQSDEGQVSLYLGAPGGASATPAWIGEPDLASVQFGAAISTAGDVNGDGFDDIIVGAPLFANGEAGEGRVFVYAGSDTGLVRTPAWIAEGNLPNANFGFSVSWAGDVNADGFADVIIGARGYTNGETGEGAAFVYTGSDTGLAATAAWMFESDSSSAGLGHSVATAGDVDADGFADIVIGAWQFTNGEAAEGRALLFRGGASGPAPLPAWFAESNQDGAGLGVSVATAGDVNGDGFADVIVGASAFDNPEINEGIVFVYYGSASGPSLVPDWSAEGNQPAAALGGSVATAGDVNGDGFADVIVGAREFDNGQLDEGRASIYFGSRAGLGTVAAWVAETNQGSSSFGCCVASAGDMNGDGYGDVLVGAERFDNPEINEGRAYLFNGRGSGVLSAATSVLNGNQAGAAFGHSVDGAGDVNGDGYSDVIIGAPFAPDVFISKSMLGMPSVTVFAGSDTGLVTSAPWVVESDQASSTFGYSVAGSGDVNGDGYADVIVGARDYDNGQPDEGRATVYAGSPTGLGATPIWTAESDQDSAGFGHSVASAGDVNGDGYSDVIVGAWKYDATFTNEGRVFVYHGGESGPSATPDWSRSSGQSNTPEYGFDVASAGDVNGDGFGDVIIGAPHFVNGEAFEGHAFVHLGSDSGLADEPAWFAEGDQASAHLGEFVASAGDVNGDGFSDVLCGGIFFDVDQLDEGRVWLYLGSASVPATSPSWTADGDVVDARMGFAGGTAGDVNNDGYSDIVAGLFFYSNGELREGSARVFLGGVSVPATAPSWNAQSNQANAKYGFSTESAGDINGDGFGDVVIGAPFFDDGETDEGRAYVYFGNGAGGLSRAPQQLRTGSAAPVATLGRSDSEASFRARLHGRTPAGRGAVAIEAEVKPFGAAFDGNVSIASGAFDTGAPQTLIGSRVIFEEPALGLDADALYHWRARIVSRSPFFPRSPWVSLPDNALTELDLRTNIDPLTDVNDGASAVSARLALDANTPEPFRAATRFAYTIPSPGAVRFAIYDAQGRLVRRLLDGVQPAGRHTIAWDGASDGGAAAAAGVYFARLDAGGDSRSRKIVRVR